MSGVVCYKRKERKVCWWSSKGAWRTPWQWKLEEGMKASWKALAINGKW